MGVADGLGPGRVWCTGGPRRVSVLSSVTYVARVTWALSDATSPLPRRDRREDGQSRCASLFFYKKKQMCFTLVWRCIHVHAREILCIHESIRAVFFPRFGCHEVGEFQLSVLEETEVILDGNIRLLWNFLFI